MGRPRSYNRIIQFKTYAVIVTKKDNFIIDLDDVNKCSEFTWFSKKQKRHTYAYTHLKNNKKLILHRFIMNVTDSDILVDHKNRNTLDNTKTNLRIASRHQNNTNSGKRINCKSKYKGLTLRPSGRWGVYIKVKDKNICLGTFDSEKEAALVYNKAAKKYFKEYAYLNNIEE